MLLKKISVLVCASFVSCVSFAQTNNIQDETDKVIDTFLQCDNQFFEQLSKHQESINQYVDLATTPDNVTYIPVESIQKPDKNKVMFKKPLKYHGLEIVGYQNIYISTTLSGQFLYWGFIFDNKQDEIKSALSNINWLHYSQNTYIANAKIYDKKSKSKTWEDDIYAIDGVIPRFGTINKALYLESSANNQSSIFCSIQGDLEKETILTARPDLKPIIEKQEAELQERIKANQEKMQKEKEKQQNQSQTNPTETNSKDGEKI
jgi:gas vesicle protein